MLLKIILDAFTSLVLVDAMLFFMGIVSFCEYRLLEGKQSITNDEFVNMKRLRLSSYVCFLLFIVIFGVVIYRIVQL
jgi:hypothetical protein